MFETVLLPLFVLLLLPLFVLWQLNIHALLLLFLFCRNNYLQPHTYRKCGDGVPLLHE